MELVLIEDFDVTPLKGRSEKQNSTVTSRNSFIDYTKKLQKKVKLTPSQYMS